MKVEKDIGGKNSPSLPDNLLKWLFLYLIPILIIFFNEVYYSQRIFFQITLLSYNSLLGAYYHLHIMQKCTFPSYCLQRNRRLMILPYFNFNILEKSLSYTIDIIQIYQKFIVNTTISLKNVTTKCVNHSALLTYWD